MSAPTALAFRPGGSWLHRLGPVPKLVWLAVIILVAFVVSEPRTLLVLAAAAILVALTSGAARPALTGLVVMTPLMASILVIQALSPTACRDGCEILARLGPLSVSAEGLSHGLALAARVAAMELAAVTLIGTIHPSDLVSALMELRVPWSFAFMLAMTLRLVPLIGEEFGAVLAAQRSRGLRARGFSALLPAIIPVFVLTVERTRRMAISLESRGIGAAGPTTSWRRVQHGPRERRLTLGGVVALVAGVAWGLAVGTGPALALPSVVAAGIVLAAALVFVATVVGAFAALSRA